MSKRDLKVDKGVATQEVTEQWFQEHGPLKGQAGGGESKSKDRDKVVLSMMVADLDSQHSRGWRWHQAGQAADTAWVAEFWVYHSCLMGKVDLRGNFN